MIALGCDHGGFELMKEILSYFDENKIEYKNFGTFSKEPCDYPEYSRLVAQSVASGESEKGILVCGSGIGISIAANKIKGIRAALCHDCFSAKATREHNNSNVLAMGGRVIGPGLAIEIVKLFINTEFSNESRHIKRIEMIED